MLVARASSDRTRNGRGRENDLMADWAKVEAGEIGDGEITAVPVGDRMVAIAKVGGHASRGGVRRSRGADRPGVPSAVRATAAVQGVLARRGAGAPVHPAAGVV